ncbi:MAG: hypothetical protein M0Z50_17045 [Planctomycetia bacterium]|nr:hypothetical protein [Planctomycetia bacterium]
MANLQHIADRIFQHVDVGRLPAGYSLVMGALIDAYDEDPDFHAWVDSVTGSAIEKLIACMVRAGKWDDPAWLREYVREASLKENAA